MGTEIERKYLVTNNSYKANAEKRLSICQGYLSRNTERTVRVRTINDTGFITIKGFTTGCIRKEYEYEIPYTDALELLDLCEAPLIIKDRYIVYYKGHKWEIDEFKGKLSHLTVAEIELNAESDSYDIPPFVGDEVTGDPQYYNSSMK